MPLLALALIALSWTGRPLRSLPRAKAMIAAVSKEIQKRNMPRPDLAVWMASARGMVALVDNDGDTAEAEFAMASKAADALPGFDATARLTFRQRLAFAKFRLGDGAGAETLFRGLVRDFTAIEGPDGPDVLMVGMNLAQALMVEGKHAEAVVPAAFHSSQPSPSFALNSYVCRAF